MKKNKGLVLSLVLFSLLVAASSVFAVEVAPRISDREIIEGLANIRGDIKKLEEGQNTIRAEIKAVDKRFDDLRWTMNLPLEPALNMIQGISGVTKKRHFATPSNL